MVNIGVVGYGYWGPNVARNFHSSPGAKLTAVSDISEKRLKLAENHYPFIKGMKDPMELVRSKDVDVVAVITPVSSHYDLAKKALENGKHVFVEKPFTSSRAQAEKLIELAAQKGPQDHGRSHLPVHGRREQDQTRHRLRGAGAAPLLRFGAGQLGTFPARRQRHLGPGPARPVHHGFPHQEQACRGFGPRVSPFPERFRSCCLRCHRIREERVHRPFPCQLAEPGEDPQDPDQRR